MVNVRMKGFQAATCRVNVRNEALIRHELGHVYTWERHPRARPPPKDSWRVRSCCIEKCQAGHHNRPPNHASSPPATQSNASKEESVSIRLQQALIMCGMKRTKRTKTRCA